MPLCSSAKPHSLQFCTSIHSHPVIWVTTPSINDREILLNFLIQYSKVGSKLTYNTQIILNLLHDLQENQPWHHIKPGQTLMEDLQELHIDNPNKIRSSIEAGRTIKNFCLDIYSTITEWVSPFHQVVWPLYRINPTSQQNLLNAFASIPHTDFLLFRRPSHFKLDSPELLVAGPRLAGVLLGQPAAPLLSPCLGPDLVLFQSFWGHLIMSCKMINTWLFKYYFGLSHHSIY